MATRPGFVCSFAKELCVIGNPSGDASKPNFPGVIAPALTAIDLPRTLRRVRLPKAFGSLALASLDLVRHAAYVASLAGS